MNNYKKYIIPVFVISIILIETFMLSNPYHSKGVCSYKCFYKDGKWLNDYYYGYVENDTLYISNNNLNGKGKQVDIDSVTRIYRKLNGKTGYDEYNERKMRVLGYTYFCEYPKEKFSEMIITNNLSKEYIGQSADSTWIRHK